MLIRNNTHHILASIASRKGCAQGAATSGIRQAAERSKAGSPQPPGAEGCSFSLNG
jgi:hypothetical protein